MIEDGVAFDFNDLPAHMIERTWIPSYCKASTPHYTNPASKISGLG
jgi:hypothetical protein